jgi:hypothetical protein
MRRPVLLLVLLALGSIAAWWLLGSPARTREVGPIEEGRPADAPDAPRTGIATAPPPPQGAGLSSAPATAPRRATPERRPQGIGSLRVRLRTEDRAPEAARVRLHLEALRGTPEAARLPLASEDGTWLYERLPAGRYRVEAMVVGFVTASVETPVDGDAEALVEIPLRPGTEIAWKAIFPGSDVPSTIQVLLFDGRGERIPATLQTPATTQTVPATGTVAVPLEGRIVGLRPGHYRVRGVSPAGEWDEHDVDARLGETTTVELRIRR